MISNDLICEHDGRREQIGKLNERNTSWNGIDYIEVESATKVIVTLLCGLARYGQAAPSIAPPAPEDLTHCLSVCKPGNCKLKISSTLYDPSAGTIVVVLDASSSLSHGKYELELSSDCNLGYGRLDQRFLRAEFEYFDNTKQLLIDPNTLCQCVAENIISEPEISYTARDFDSFRRLISDRLALTIPQWRETHVPDIGVAITEIMAYVADHLAQYQDAVATEAYLSTARSRISARRHARLIDYEVDEGSNSRAFLHFEVASDVDITPDDMYFITLPADRPEFAETNLAESLLRDIPKSRYKPFEIVQPQPETINEFILPELRDPLVLLIQIQFIPCHHKSPWYPLVNYIRQSCRQVVNSVLPLEAGIGTAWRYAKSLLTLTAPHVQMLIDHLNALLTSKNLCKLIDRNLLPAELQEQIACYHPEWDRPQINQIVLNYLFPDQFKLPNNDATKIRLHESHNQIALYTWGQTECCLNKGATHATLLDRWIDSTPEPRDASRLKPIGVRDQRNRVLRLQVGDLLLLEEVVDPRTGEKLDANPKQRQVVRLTCVRYDTDKLTDTPIVEVWWGQKDELQFTLCVSSRRPSPPCSVLPTVGVARGNILHVDQGLTIVDDNLGFVSAVKPTLDCSNHNIFDPQSEDVGKFRPRLNEAGLAFVNTPDLKNAASTWLAGPKRGTRGIPDIRLLGIPGKPEDSANLENHKPIICPKQLRAPEGCGACIAYLDEGSSIELQNAISPELGQYFVALQKRAQHASGEAIRLWGKILCRLLLKEFAWKPKPDLMESDLYDRDFTVEVDDYGYARLRFGDGLGKQPTAGMHFYASYRVGSGQGGNVGADSIVRVVFRRGLHTVIRTVRNPLPGVGGRDAESLNHIKLHAPHALHDTDRAIIAEDYVRIVRREFTDSIQGVNCSITAQTYVVVAIDPKGNNRFDYLKPKIAAVLEVCRRIGHLVTIKEAIGIGIDIEIQLSIDIGQSESRIQLALLQRLGSGLLTNGEPAFFNPDRLTFGDSIYRSQVIAEVMKVEGIVNITFDKFQRTDVVAPKVEDVLHFAEQEIPKLSNNPSDPNGGHLLLKF